MRLLSISLRNLRKNALTSILTTISILIGTALVSFIWTAARQTDSNYRASIGGYPAILGPTGTSELDLVLTTVFHIGQSQGVIPVSVFREVHSGRLSRRLGVRYAIPKVVGDSFRGRPIIGTTDEFFSRFGVRRDEKGRPVPLAMREGRSFVFGFEDLLEEAGLQAERLSRERRGEGGRTPEAPEAWKEVVLGSKVAGDLGLRLGSKIVPAHGIQQALEQHGEARCKVVGILEETRTPVDSALYIPIGLFYRIEGHEASGRGTGDVKPGEIELSAIVVDTKHPVGNRHLKYEFQRRPEAQVAIPADVIPGLLLLVGDVVLALRGISWLVILVAAISVFVSLYNTMHQRRREVAIMRSLGARRRQVFGIVLLEAILIAGSGAAGGLLAAHLSILLLSGWLEGLTGVALSGFPITLGEIWLLLAVTLLGGLSGFLPAYRASCTDVARNLNPL